MFIDVSSPMRLSAYIAKKYNISRRYAKSLIADGKVRSETAALRKDIEVGSEEYFAEIETVKPAYDYDTYLIKDCGSIIFFYKPFFMHTERHTPKDPFCLDDVLVRFPGYRLLSRLDYGVDGVIPAALQDIRILQEEKTYLTWVEGDFIAEVCERWDVDAAKRKKVRVFRSESGILMKFSPIKRIHGTTLLEITLEKAHRHQVRAVCAAMGHPITGDHLYGTGKDGGRIMLHCLKASVNGISCESPNHKEFTQAQL